MDRALGFVIGIGTGGVFGYALEKSKVYLPVLIRQQMRFQDFTMLKVFLMATAVGSLSIGLMEALNVVKRKPKPPVALGLGLMKGYGGNIVGGGLLGIGMYIVGGCPGTLAVQVGAGVENSLYAYLGGITGCLLFGYFENHVKKAVPSFGTRGQATMVDHRMNLGTLAGSVVFSGLGAGAVYLLENMPTSNLPGSWHPAVSGAVVGLLQIPALLLIGTHLGTSSSYCTVAGTIAGVVDPKRDAHAPYFSKFFSKEDFWQLGVVAGMASAGYYAAPTHSLANGISPAVAFFGSAVMLFGARFGGGCTSGHGISGMATLSTASFVSVISMFAGAMGTALLF